MNKLKTSKKDKKIGSKRDKKLVLKKIKKMVEQILMDYLQIIQKVVVCVSRNLDLIWVKHIIDAKNVIAQI